jgi:hypothetical protein
MPAQNCGPKPKREAFLTPEVNASWLAAGYSVKACLLPTFKGFIAGEV